MQKSFTDKFLKLVFIISCIFVVYMPLHVIIVQSASLVTGGLEVWKAAKDVLTFLALPALAYLVVKKRLYQDKTFRLLMILGLCYGLIHGLFLVFSRSDDTYSTLVASVYNTRILIFFLMGYAIAKSENRERYIKLILTAIVIIASLVALFGVLQYFLPKDILSHVGYSLERGVKPMFFIDDKPDLPRVMSTLKDPNSLGAYLILPILLSGFAFINKKVNRELFLRPFRRGTLVVMLTVQIAALFLTFSRGALIALTVSLVTLLYIVTGKRLVSYVKKYWAWLAVLVAVFSGLVFVSWNTYTFQNIVFHADQSTVLEDPNELRVSLTKKAVDGIESEPLGHGPGTAGLIAITNPKSGVLTENYYLQIAYEVGLVGVVLFVAVLGIVMFKLYLVSIKGIYLAAIVVAAGVGYVLQSLLIHLWSNEAVALQWWLLAGLCLGYHMSNSPVLVGIIKQKVKVKRKDI